MTGKGVMMESSVKFAISLVLCVSSGAVQAEGDPAFGDERIEPEVGLFIGETCFLPGDPETPVSGSMALLDFCTEARAEELPLMFAGKFGAVGPAGVVPLGAAGAPGAAAGAIPDPDGYVGGLPGLVAGGAALRAGGGLRGSGGNLDNLEQLADVCVFACGTPTQPGTETLTNPIAPAPVPLPAPLILLAAALAALVPLGRRQKHALA